MIRNRFNVVSLCVTPVTESSLCIPDESLSIKDLFDRYQVNTAELHLLARMRQSKSIDDVKVNDLVPDLDANQVFELRKRLAAKYKDASIIDKVIPATEPKEPITDIPAATE